MNNTFKTYQKKGNDFLPIGYMNYEMIHNLFYILTDEYNNDYKYMIDNPSFYGYASIEIFDNDINSDDDTNYYLTINDKYAYEISSVNSLMRDLNMKHIKSINDTKTKLNNLIINRNNKILIKKELLKICKYDGVYEILKFI